LTAHVLPDGVVGGVVGPGGVVGGGVVGPGGVVGGGGGVVGGGVGEDVGGGVVGVGGGVDPPSQAPRSRHRAGVAAGFHPAPGGGVCAIWAWYNRPL
jgi:hypothetical protein